MKLFGSELLNTIPQAWSSVCHRQLNIFKEKPFVVCCFFFNLYGQFHPHKIFYPSLLIGLRSARRAPAETQAGAHTAHLSALEEITP